ncbi:DeoR/GlpR family DNA-binding transcription regulator [Planctomycetota bacterium]
MANATRYQRHNEILRLLRSSQKELLVPELAQRFGVTASTIRRDLDVLESNGSILRTHGGCVSLEQAAFESEYHAKVSRNFKLKQAIGRAAAGIVFANNTILISDGSTNFHLAASLKNASGISVFTNSIEMINELSRNEQIGLHMLGGEYKRTVHCLGGAMTEQILETLMFDTVFLGTDGIDAKGNCLVSDPSEARIAHLMVRRGRKAVLLADHTKVNGHGYTSYGSLADFDMWITSKGLKKSHNNRFKKMTEILEA